MYYHDTACRHVEVFSELTVLNRHPSRAALLRIFEPLQLDAAEGNFLRAELHSYTYSITPLPGPSSLYSSSSSSFCSETAQGLVLDLPKAVLESALPPASSAALEEQGQGQGPVAVRFSLTLPAHSALVVSLRLHKRFLKRELVPTDASKGMHMASGAVHWRWQSGEGSEDEAKESSPWHSYIPAVTLISIPFPDGSMPFNVITMVSTVMALLLGSMMNVLVRKSSLKQKPAT